MDFHRLLPALLVTAGALTGSATAILWTQAQSSQSGAGPVRTFTYALQQAGVTEAAVVVPPGEFVLTDARVSRNAQTFWSPASSQPTSEFVAVTIVRLDGTIVPFGTMHTYSNGHLFDRSGIALRGGDRIEVYGTAATPGLLVTFTGYEP